MSFEKIFSVMFPLSMSAKSAIDGNKVKSVANATSELVINVENFSVIFSHSPWENSSDDFAAQSSAQISVRAAVND